MVELDPIPAYNTDVDMPIEDWYHYYYGNYYKEDSYKKHNAGIETAPKYTLEKIKELVQSVQGLTDEALKHQLERMIEPAGDGLYRFTYDQRMKHVTLLPFPSEFLKKIYTAPTTPTFAILAEEMVDLGAYDDVPFLRDPSAWPNKNFRYKIVPGGHDVHLNDPGSLTWGDALNPPVLLCPGRMQPCTIFRPLVLRLPNSFFYVALDLPGNGSSDTLPLGVRFSIQDLVPSVLTVVEHYEWKNFSFGKYFNLAYPGRVSKMVELDPIPAYNTDAAMPIGDWYHYYYGNYYKEESYKKYNDGVDTAPKYTLEKIKELLRNVQDLTDEALKHHLERIIEPAGDGLYRFTYDQRMKHVTLLPFPSEFLKKIYTAPTTPTFAILAEDEINLGTYDDVPFLRDPSAWPNKNFKYKIVPGGHVVHLNDPGCMADDISQFLLENKSKL
ncbi:Serine hydrolase-like protein [Papilio machaon]|uniref:Serine hydrolase-like protein n=1 Tax=Papilio machaon TaxID=76193 RepID=A0A0N0PC95_PAPMA|nr:Serine hydrolase-like protein [Papilio machaon]